MQCANESKFKGKSMCQFILALLSLLLFGEQILLLLKSSMVFFLMRSFFTVFIIKTFGIKMAGCLIHRHIKVEGLTETESVRIGGTL